MNLTIGDLWMPPMDCITFDDLSLWSLDQVIGGMDAFHFLLFVPTVFRSFYEL